MPFVDLAKHHRPLRKAFLRKAAELYDSAQFILGEEVAAFEREFAAFVGAGHAVGVSNGYDALRLILEGLGVGAGDEVVVPAFTFAATAFAVSHAGATPRFADVDRETYTLDPARFEAAITPRTKAVIPVHLYGHPADMDPILEIARARGLKVVEDAAQAHGATYRGRRAGSLGDAAAWSFYPSKNLGAIGDGGAVTTSDAALADRVRVLRNCGSRGRYVHDAVGYNNRLDNLQAAFLRLKLKVLEKANARRRRAAAAYGKALGKRAPVVRPWAGAVWHQYVVRLPERDAVQKRLDGAGIPSVVYYPVPLHLQPCYRDLGGREGDHPESERAAREVLALPMHPELTSADIRRVVRALAL